MRDHYELSPITVLADERQEAPYVQVVERSLYLVQNVEGARASQEQREQERDGGHRLLPTGE